MLGRETVLTQRMLGLSFKKEKCCGLRLVGARLKYLLVIYQPDRFISVVLLVKLTAAEEEGMLIGCSECKDITGG